MTNRNPAARAMLRAPLGSAVLLKSRFARYLESLRLAMSDSRHPLGSTLHARLAPDRLKACPAPVSSRACRPGFPQSPRSVLEAFRLPRCDHMRAGSDAIEECLE